MKKLAAIFIVFLFCARFSARVGPRPQRTSDRTTSEGV